MTQQRPGNAKNLTPFEKGSDRARQAALKSVESRKRKKAQQEVQKVQVDDLVNSVMQLSGKVNVGEAAEGLLLTLIARVERGDITVTGSDAVGLMKVAHEISRLERGAPTSLHGTISGRVDDLTRVRALRAQAGGAIGPGDEMGGVDGEP